MPRNNRSITVKQQGYLVYIEPNSLIFQLNFQLNLLIRSI